jgi:hypothetical protein
MVLMHLGVVVLVNLVIFRLVKLRDLASNRAAR